MGAESSAEPAVTLDLVNARTTEDMVVFVCDAQGRLGFIAMVDAQIVSVDGNSPAFWLAQLGGADASLLVDGKTPVAWVAAAVERVVVEHGEDPGTFARAARHLGEILERHAEAVLSVGVRTFTGDRRGKFASHHLQRTR